MKVRHPKFPQVVYDVDDERADSWLRAGWLPEGEPDPQPVVSADDPDLD